ncbi:pirin family protein [Flavobacteriaceae bacterium]|nr:pirin family protein [Flavobacteriaceae bacterium]
MEKIIHKANSRGHAFHGWLESYHSFSFASYRNPERMHFGVLRVLNDDRVAPGQGFGTHPHENMEIISIPLKGDLEHKDSMGNTTVIKSGDIQIMSAGTGVQHSEYNKNEDAEVEFLQIWIIPRVRNVPPRYDQIAINSFAKSNEFYQILSPNAGDQGVWIHQNAWFSMGDFEKGIKTLYTLHDQVNGVYVFVLEGSIEIDDSQLNRRDAIGLWDTREFEVTSSETAKVLLMEVPMSL